MAKWDIWSIEITCNVVIFPASVTHDVRVDTGLTESLDDVVGNLFGDLLTDVFDTTFGQIGAGRTNLIDHIVDSTDDPWIGDGFT